LPRREFTVEDAAMAGVITLRVNGVAHQVAAEPDRNLLGVLRDELDLTGSKYGCGEGFCGACTVVIDGRAIRSCHTSLSTCAGKAITTIEGLERDGTLHPLQQAFLNAGAMQCGYCTPGMIMNGYALLGRLPAPTTEEIARSMEGNVCRCGTYVRILQAIRQAADAMKLGHGNKSLTEAKDGPRAKGRIAVQGGVE
jgi:aerobic-type carbon monoxide dehydrogenase small subunit (CoxS/CutS family)